MDNNDNIVVEGQDGENLEVYTNDRCPDQPMIFKILCSKDVDLDYVCDCLQRISIELEKEKDYKENGNINKTVKKIKEFNKDNRFKMFYKFIDDNGFPPFPKNLLQCGKIIDVTEDIEKSIDFVEGVFVSNDENNMFAKLDDKLIEEYNLINKIIPYVAQKVRLKDDSVLIILLINPISTLNVERGFVTFEKCENCIGIKLT